MQVLAIRRYPFIEFETLVEGEAQEILVREPDGFYLYMRSSGASANGETILQLETRDALIWLNETEDEYGGFWRSMQHNPTIEPCRM
jgi:hypothetical protein